MKRVAHTLAKVVMKFWSSAEVLLNSDDPTVVQKNCKYGLGGSRRIDGNEVSEDKIGESDMVLIIFLRPFFFFFFHRFGLCDDSNSVLYKWLFLLSHLIFNGYSLSSPFILSYIYNKMYLAVLF